MLIYPIEIEPDTNGSLLVRFPDVPEAATFGEDEADAKAHAVDALMTMFSSHMDDRRPIPMPTALKGNPGVILPVGIAAKVILWNAMLGAGLRKADLARKLNVSPTVVDRLLSLTHASRIEQIESALAALGKKLVVGVSEAA
ncbi:MAG: type II toxin-antitoxin system HicB family antitoxin [Syntrophobacteraceae bacterium]